MRGQAAGSPQPAAPGEVGAAWRGQQAPALSVASCPPRSRQDKEAWIKDKYVEKKFLRKPPCTPAREAPRRWRALKCPGHHSSPRPPPTRRKVRMEPVLPSVAALSSGGRASGSPGQAWGWGRAAAALRPDPREARAGRQEAGPSVTAWSPLPRSRGAQVPPGLPLLPR